MATSSRWQLRRRQMGALGCGGIEAEAEKLPVEVVGGRAGERGLREHGAALAHHQDVPVADEVGSDEAVDLQGGDVARSADGSTMAIGPLFSDERAGTSRSWAELVRPAGRLRFSGTMR